MADRFQFRRDTAANWSLYNPVLMEGEVGFVTDDSTYKIGDGVKDWNTLPYRTLSGLMPDGALMSAIPNPSTPPAGQGRMYMHSVAGKVLPKFVGPSGLDTVLQSSLGTNGCVLISPSTSAAVTTFGVGAPTIVGTLGTPNIVPSTIFRAAIKRTTITSGSTSSSSADLRTTALCYRGEEFAPGIYAGGFFMQVRFAVSSIISKQRCAVGLWNSTAATPAANTMNSHVNGFFVGWDSGDANLSLMHNDDTGLATKIDLGSQFSAKDPDAVFEFSLFCEPAGDVVGYRVNRLDTGATVSGVIDSTDIPTKATTLCFHATANNNGTAGATVVLELMRFYLETDY